MLWLAHWKGSLFLIRSLTASCWRCVRLFSCNSGLKRRSIVFVLVISVPTSGCHSRLLKSGPTLQLTQVPPAEAGGPVLLSPISGRANGARADQQIVIYAYNDGNWWIQPLKSRPFTKIQPDSTWQNSVHLGTRYAALLVEPGYHASPKSPNLPGIGNGVVAEVTAYGTATPIVQKMLHFSGYDWTVRSGESYRGGKPNSYDSSNAWTDQKGFLHLRMTVHDGEWSCAEVAMTRSLGFGTYRFVVEDSARLEPSAVLGMFTADEKEETRSELDIEMSQWGNPSGKNAQYVVQPFYVPQNVARFVAPEGVLTHILHWEPESASFKTIRGSGVTPGSKTISEHVFSSGVPKPAAEKVHIDLYHFHHARNVEQHPAEVVIEKFEYFP